MTGYKFRSGNDPLADWNRLWELFVPDFINGILTRRIAVGGRFGRVGCGVGYLDRQGYIVTEIDGRFFSVHRALVVMATGEWPEEVDHANGVRSDNRLKNLLMSNKVFNQRNRFFAGSRSGVLGVYPATSGDRFYALITVRRKRIYLGVFDTIEEAAAARKAAEREHGFSLRHGQVRPGGAA